MSFSLSSRFLSLTARGLVLGTLFACSSENADPVREPEPVDSLDFGATETWDIEAGGKSGTVTIKPTAIDFSLGDHRAAITLDANGLLDVRLHDAEGEVRYSGSRRSVAPLALGVSALSLGGEWFLTDTPPTPAATGEFTTLGFNATTSKIEARCLGPDCADIGVEGTIEARATSSDKADGFGDAAPRWDVGIDEKLEDTDSRHEAVLRLADRTITLEVDGQTKLDLTWEGRTMSGTVGTREFAAVKR